MQVTGAAVAAGLGASLFWASAGFVRFGVDRSAAAFVAALCCASSVSVPVLAAARLIGSSPRAGGRLVLPALLALAPIAIFGGVIETHTHHRALGAVTFTVGATMVLVVSSLVVRRILDGAATGVVTWRSLRYGLLGACALSAAWIVWTLSSASSPARVRDGTIDAVLGVAAVAVFYRLPQRLMPKLLERAAPGAFLVVMCAGTLMAWKNAPSFAVLCQRAPVTSGIFGLLGCP